MITLYHLNNNYANKIDLTLDFLDTPGFKLYFLLEKTFLGDER